MRKVTPANDDGNEDVATPNEDLDRLTAMAQRLEHLAEGLHDLLIDFHLDLVRACERRDAGRARSRGPRSTHRGGRATS